MPGKTKKSSTEIEPKDFAADIMDLTGGPRRQPQREYAPSYTQAPALTQEQYLANMSYGAQVVLECAGCGYMHKKRFTTGKQEEDRLVRCYMEEFRCTRCGSVQCTVAARIGWK